MDSMTISKFKATCLAVLERVRNSGQPILVTRRGKPIAQIVPPPSNSNATGFGSMAGRAKELGDILEPLGDDDWEVAH